MKKLMGKTVAANLFRGIEAVGGKITFNEDCIVFNSHKLNIQAGSTLIAYSNIKNVQKRSTLGFVPNGIYIITKNGEEYKFVVNGRKNIIEFLNAMIFNE